MTPTMPATQTKTAYAKKPDDERPAIPKTRRCLKCRTPFGSAWAGERICSKCKASSDWRSGGAGVSAAWNV